ECYDDQRGCFHGNVTLRMGNLTWSRELWGCAPDGSCSRERRGDDSASLVGSCCHGDLCNRPPGNKTFFSPDLPRLELLPHGHAPTAAPENVTA
ncbi:LYPD3 protein, partial [Sterrhoptilus dennistouni]|nr:LYPD3 protein [Sterrhoptilus dennistouni]